MSVYPKIKVSKPFFLRRVYDLLTKTNTAELTNQKEWYQWVIKRVQKGCPLWIVCGEGDFVVSESFQRILKNLGPKNELQIAVSAGAPNLDTIKKELKHVATRESPPKIARLYVYPCSKKVKNHFSISGTNVYVELPHGRDEPDEAKLAFRFHANVPCLCDFTDRFNEIIFDDKTVRVM